MKVLFIAHSNEFQGGANRSLLTLVTELKKRNHEVKVLVPNEKGNFDKILSEKGITVEKEKYNRIITSKKNGIKKILSSFKMNLKYLNDYFINCNKIKKIQNYDLIYTNSRSILIGIFLSRKYCIPHIWHLRELFEENGIQTVRNEINLLNNELNNIITISNFMHTSLLHKGVKKEKMKVIYNGIEIRPPKKAIVKKNYDFNNMVIIGTIMESKGQLLVIEAVNELIRCGLEIKLTIVGSPPGNNYDDLYYKKIQSYIIEKKIEKNIIFTGEIKKPDTVREINSIEIVSSSYEAFGRVVIEGMRNALLVVGSNSGAIPELIKNDETGILFEYKNSEDLEKKLRYCLENSMMSERIAKEGYYNSQSNWTVNELVNNVENYIKEVSYEHKQRI
jgi:glycosyltransferase involved in cell wall biosynthesis